jgi:pSer/pThr/pTyr-binding forkhead associated (FHA) protein
MKHSYGAIIADPQGVSIKDNSTGVFGFGRSSITSVSLVADSIYDQVVPEVYTDSEMPVNCKVAAGRDESDFYEAFTNVSRRHCAIVNYLDDVWLCDLGSTQGVFVGRGTPAGVSVGDTLKPKDLIWLLR